MFVVSNLLVAVAQVLDLVLTLYGYVLLGRVLISWVNPDPYNPIVRFLYNATEPLLYRIRRAAPFLVVGGMDLSPVAIFVGLGFLRTLLVGSLHDLAMTVR